MSAGQKLAVFGVALGLLAAGDAAFPAPNIGALSGTVSSGNTLTVSGTGFGQFGGQIVSWDDFEAQPLGSSINGSNAKIGGQWTTQFNYVGKGARFDNQRTHSGDRAAHLDWSIDPYTIRAFGWSSRGPFSRLFISYWRHMEGNYVATEADNHKQFYLFGNTTDSSTGQAEMPQLMLPMPAREVHWGWYNNDGQAIPWGDSINSLGWQWSNTKDKFQRWDIWTVLNDVSMANGVVRLWLDGALGLNNTRAKIRHVNGQFKDFRLGHMTQGFNETARAWFDDLYVATTQARVELCDSPTWSKCTHREIQIADPTRWSDTQLSFQVRLGSFSSFTGKYPYVVDADGATNEFGFPVAGTGPQPLPPTGVSVN